MFTGDNVSAQRALALGIVNHVVPRDDLEPFTHRLAMRVALGASKDDQKAWLNKILLHGYGVQAAFEEMYPTWEHDLPDEAADGWRAQLRDAGVRAAVQWRRERFEPYEEQR